MPGVITTYLNYGTINILSSKDGLLFPSGAQYRLLQQHFFNYFPITNSKEYAAGLTIIEGVDVPFGWIPTPNVDPLNTQAVQAFYNAGPSLLGLVVTQFSNLAVAPPTTFWVEAPGSPSLWHLTGLGANTSVYPPKFMG